MVTAPLLTRVVPWSRRGDSPSPMVAVPPVGTVMVPPPSGSVVQLGGGGQGAGAGEVAAGEVEGAGAGPGGAGEVEGAVDVVVAGAAGEVVGAGAGRVDRVGHVAARDVRVPLFTMGTLLRGTTPAVVGVVTVTVPPTALVKEPKP